MISIFIFKLISQYRFVVPYGFELHNLVTLQLYSTAIEAWLAPVGQVIASFTVLQANKQIKLNNFIGGRTLILHAKL